MANPFERFKVRFAAGEYIFRDGDVGTEMYIVQTGRVALVKEVLGREEIVAELEKGDFFGEMAVLESLPRNLGARALDPTELVAVNGSTFDKMIKSNIEISVRMLRKFSSRIREADEENVRLMYRNRALEEGAGHGAAAIAAPTAATPEPAFVAAMRAVATAAPATAAPVVAAPAPAGVPAESPGAVRAPDPVKPIVPVAPPTAPSPAPVASPAVVKVPAAAVVPPLRKAAYLVVKGTERKYPLNSDDLTVGRADPVTGLRPEIDLSTEDVNRFISRRHAKLLYKDGTYYLVEEVGVTNGTYLNGKRLQAGVYSPVRHGDELCFGKVFVTFLEGA